MLTDLFLGSVARHPSRVAVDVPPANGRDRVRVSFAQLERMANHVAAELAPHLCGESRIVVLVPRQDPWLIAAQLGVLAGGGAFACVDPSFPDAHLRHVVRDTGAVAVVTAQAFVDRFAGLGVPVVVVPGRCDVPTRAVAPGPSRPDHLAYVIYTSGTTGRPKGVCIEHRGVVNLIREGIARFAIGPGDRIAQGSSPAYDSSVEEIWLGLASGATVVVMDDETVRLGPDLLPWLRAERITVLCPPPTLLRTLGCRSPRDELPDLRLAYVGGEPLPADLAAVWGRDLWLENGYGPTECTVTVVRGRVRAGAPITIGTPVPPHVAHVLGPDLRPVPAGTPGELCIEGPGLARGYLGLEALTAERFPTLPGIGRVYRTGDLVVRDGDGELRHLGRIDAQVKVRGHRIELEAVEAVLARAPGVREVVCTVQGDEPDRDLVAHIVPADGNAAPPFEALAARVRAELPAIAVPTRFALLARVPRTVGGKVDRRALPFVGVPAARGDEPGDDSVAGRVRRAFADALALPAGGFGDDDDFFALGGNSLRAALLVSRLRTDGRVPRLAVRDLYEAPTVRGLVSRAGASSAAATVEPRRVDAALPSRATVVAFTLGQVAFLVVALGATAAGAWLLSFDLLPWFLRCLPLGAVLLVAPWFVLATAGIGAIALWWFVVAAKELLIGRYVPCRVSAWSGLRLRHWIVTTLARLLPWSFCAGTELHSVLLRSLGARIGRRVYVHRGVDLAGGGWDLLEIGDDAALCREVDLGLCELDAGEFVVGPVRIGAGATLATRAGTARDVVVGDGACVTPLSFVAAGTRVPDGATWSGVPAAPGSAVAPPRAGDNVGASWRHSAFVLGMRAAVGPLSWLPIALLAWAVATWAGIDGAAFVDWLCRAGPWTRASTAVFVVALAVAAVPAGLLQTALLLRWSPKVPAGAHGLWTARSAWLSVRSAWLERAGTWLSGTLFWPWWLRLAGMRIGSDVEISTIFDVLPEHTSIGAGSFLADGIYLGVPQIHCGVVTVAPTELGARTFVGNHVVVPAGQRLPDDLLLGISTIADDTRMQSGTGWFGQPPFLLPRREVVAVDRALTHEPGPLRYTNRLFWEALRFLLPALLAVAGLAWFALAESFADRWVGSMVATIGTAGLMAAVVVATKWLLLGRVRPGQHGLWSCWASRWDFHYVLWQRCGRTLLQALEGTALLPWFLRLMGMRIGRACVLGDGFAQVVDPDMITIEDGATVHALFQAHSFEDRVLKIDRVRLGRGCTVGRGAVVLYGTDVGDGTHVLAHSVVMKRETLLPGRGYAGAPTVEVAPSPPPPAAVTNAQAAPGRIEAFDLARGLAVLGMLWLHFVPEPGEGAAGPFASIVRASLAWFEGVPAATFLMLAGATWTLRARTAAWVGRRAFAMAAIGLPFWWWVWPNDVLVPLAIMLPLTVALHRVGRGALAAAIAALLVAVPFAGAAFADVVAHDLLDDGTHVANHAFGSATARWFTFDGAYPLLPWACLPLLGAVVAGARDPARHARQAVLGLSLAIAGHVVPFAAAIGGGDVDASLLATWQPTTLVFVAQRFGAALAVTAGIAWWLRLRALPRWLAPVAAVGRMSLTHYLVHTCIVFASLRHWWPQEDWSVATGAAVAAAYAAFALAVSGAWLRRAGRGPAEALLARASGERR